MARSLTHSRVANNSGAGISNHNFGTLTLTNSVVAHNSGVGIGSGGILVLTNSTVAYNSNGGIGAGGTATLTNARIVDNSTAGEGGGIFNHALSYCRSGAGVTLTNSTVSGNSAGRGGGISNSGPCPAAVTLTNSTVARNSATQEGGGIRQVGSDETSSEITNSLVAQNSAPTGPDVLTGPESEVIARFNLIGDGSGSGIPNTDGNQVGTVSPNSSAIGPRLGPLADNGGPTRTDALLLGSPAIDAASTPDCPTTDQRGVLRPQGAACDIGSYERE